MRKLIIGIAALAFVGCASPAFAGLTVETGQGSNGSGPVDPTKDYPGQGIKPIFGGGSAGTGGGGVFVAIGNEYAGDPMGSPDPLWGRASANVSPDNGVQVYAEDYMANNRKAGLVNTVDRLLGCPLEACPNPYDKRDDSILITLTLP
jgi:hypothetical protein